jgi:dolichyl-phosphate-mannose-protein mannosyltransferase
MKQIPYILGLLLALTLLVGMRLPFLRCEAFVPGAPLLYDEKDYLHGARSFAAGDTTSDTVEAWIRAPATAWVLLTVARMQSVPPALAGCDFQLLQIGMWALVLLLVAAIAAQLFGRRAALASALVVALLPVAMSVTLMIHADTLFSLGLLATFWALLLYARQQRLIWLVVAGLAAGGSTLTRSLLLPLLPLLALWLIAVAWGARPSSPHPPSPVATGEGGDQSPPRLPQRERRPGGEGLLRLAQLLLPCALFVGLLALAITPWIWRNYQLYGGFIPSDTTGAINLFRDNVSGTDVNFTTIRLQSPNPVGRQRYATQRAWQAISADPARFARKFVYSSLIGWSPGEFRNTRTFITVLLERPRTASLLTHMTMLLWFTVPLAVLGMLFAPRAAPGARGYRAVMLAMALLYTVLIGVTHFEERYRLPYLLLWLPYAGWCLAHPRALLARLRRPAGLIAVGAIVVVALFYIPLIWPAQWDDARALAVHARGLLRDRAGDQAGALADQQAAAALQPELREARVAAAQLQARAGDQAGAEQTLRATLRNADLLKQRTPADATVALQQLLYAQGRIAESTALDSALDPAIRSRAEALAWGRGAAPGPALRLGLDDLGLVSGFYSSAEEQPFRWSGPRAQMLLAGPGQYACLRATANRPPGMSAPLAQLSAHLDGGAAVTLQSIRPPRQGWAWLCAPLPAPADGAQTNQIELDLRAPTYNPFAAGLDKDARDLGLAISDVELRDGPLALDPESGLLLDYMAAAPEPAEGLRLLGISGVARGKPGTNVPITLWWRATQAPPQGVFTFLHVLDAAGQKVADYNAPLAGDQRPRPWDAAEPLLDQAALALPANLAPGQYRLIGGAFDLASGARLAQAELGMFVVE